MKVLLEKNKISNFRPVSSLTTFSKIYDKVAKRSLEADTNKFLSSFLSAYRKNYCKHVLIRLVDEWIELLISLIYI